MIETLVVDEKGTKLAYIDSGAPSDAYITIFAVHGMAFNAGIFERVQALAGDAGIRFVAVTRRNYQGSTPFTESELKTLNTGSEEEKTAFVVNRGVEFLNFIDKFLAEKQIPVQPPQNGKPGGVAILGWSIGNTVTLAAFANLKSIAPNVQARLGPLIHTLILHEPAKRAVGHAPDPRGWIPLSLRGKKAEIPFVMGWNSSYFQHGGLSTQNSDELEYHVPGFNLRPPTIYSIVSAGRGSVVETGTPAKGDIPYQIRFSPQLLASYNAIYSKEIRDLYPNLKAFFIGGEHSPAYGPTTTWMVQGHDMDHGGGFIKAKLLKGINHFSMWDDPEITLKAYQDCINRTF